MSDQNQKRQETQDRTALANRVKDINQSYFGVVHGYDVRVVGDTWQVLEVFGDVNDPHFDINYEGDYDQVAAYLDGMSVVMGKTMQRLG